MEIKPIPKRIVDEAKRLEIESIELSFSGGSDEGYIDIQFGGAHVYTEKRRSFRDKVEEWAWSVYSYSGDREGRDYGDDIVYNLKTGMASHSDWFYERVDNESSEGVFSIIADEVAS